MVEYADIKTIGRDIGKNITQEYELGDCSDEIYDVIMQSFCDNNEDNLCFENLSDLRLKLTDYMTEILLLINKLQSVGVNDNKCENPNKRMYNKCLEGRLYFIEFVIKCFGTISYGDILLKRIKQPYRVNWIEISLEWNAKHPAKDHLSPESMRVKFARAKKEDQLIDELFNRLEIKLIQRLRMILIRVSKNMLHTDTQPSLVPISPFKIKLGDVAFILKSLGFFTSYEKFKEDVSFSSSNIINSLQNMVITGDFTKEEALRLILIVKSADLQSHEKLW